jgi:hypothetical protein
MILQAFLVAQAVVAVVEILRMLNPVILLIPVFLILCCGHRERGGEREARRANGEGCDDCQLSQVSVHVFSCKVCRMKIRTTSIRSGDEMPCRAAVDELTGKYRISYCGIGTLNLSFF